MPSNTPSHSRIGDRRTARKRDADEQVADARAAKRARHSQAVNMHQERDRRCNQDLLVDRNSDSDELRTVRGMYSYFLLRQHLSAYVLSIC